MTVFLNLFIIICIFIIGTLFGSFFSLATYRIPRKEDIISTRSYCPNCKHKLNFFDLIPVFSYIFLLGKCKYCKNKISIRYFLLEFLNGIIFVILFLIFGYTFNLLFVIILYIALVLIIGSYIMKSKMTDDEKKQVLLKKESKVLNKKGVFISELVIAMILFTVLLASSYIISRNYQNKSIVTLTRSNAVSIAIKNVELALATNYDSLISTKNSEIIDQIKYSIKTDVTKYSDYDTDKKDIIKKIEVTVSYLIDGKQNEFKLNTLKGKVL